MSANSELNQDHVPAQQVQLSVVIIGRNEEQFIAQAISSALEARAYLDSVEVIFVDSASTDRSVEIAQEFPIRILQLKREWPLCVAAGRYIGYLHSHGQYIFFQDGDSEVSAEWLSDAVQFMQRFPEYGAVAGVLNEEYIDGSGVRCGGRNNVNDQDLTKAVIESKILGGLALFRRQAIEKAGPVNPHLPTAEDHELCMRVRKSGFKTARIKGLMAVKYTENRDSLQEIIRRSRTKMYDYGTVIRYAGTYGSALQFCLDAIPYLVSFVATIVAFLIVVPLAVFFELIWVPAVLVAILAVMLIIKKRGFHGALLSLTVRIVSTYRTIKSLVSTKIKLIEDYPKDVIHVQ